MLDRVILAFGRGRTPTTAQRPASSMPYAALRRRLRPWGPVRRSLDGTSNARSPPKLSEVTRPSATNSASASSTCERRRPVTSISSSKNDAPFSLMQSTSNCARGLGCAAASRGVTDVHIAGVAPGQQHNRRRPHRRRPSTAIGPAVAGSQPHPGDMAGETAFVEPARLIVGESRGQNLALPRGRGSLEAFKLRHHTIKRLRPCHPRSADTCCQENRKRKKSRAATGSISARSRLSV